MRFRPWDDLEEAPAEYALSWELTCTRCFFWDWTRPIWYLGERVVRQHSSDYPLVPVDPPESMMGRDDLFTALRRVRRYGGPGIPWQTLVFRGGDYEEFISRLAPPIGPREAVWIPVVPLF